MDARRLRSYSQPVQQLPPALPAVAAPSNTLGTALPTPELSTTHHTPVEESPLTPLPIPTTLSPSPSLSPSLSLSNRRRQDSSDSDYSFPTYRPLNMPKSGVTLATFSQDAITKPPILSAGEISPETLASWDDGARGYFAHKNVKDSDQVRLISYGFQDPRIRQWIHLKQTELFALTYDEFLTQVRTKWLPHDWTSRLSNALLNARQGSTPFAAWQLDVQSRNASEKFTTGI